MSKLETKQEAGINERPLVATISTDIPPNPPEVQAALSRAELKKQLVTILERGIVDDRLKVDLPPELHGQWVRNDPFSIERLQNLGFRVDTEYATKRALHNDGTGKPLVADVVHMICDRERYEIIEEIRREQFIAVHGTKDTIAGKTARELKEYGAQLTAETEHAILPLNQSSQRAVVASELAETLRKLDAQGG